ncbi:type VI secretion system baseplate subunit TssE [Prosthecobacter sp. SYSU 5D2]|uniref:type VI secretion system baseplate subunit TssE n=1 Tax=Prosthecobacter sp. SYSU 5D2 TaxID=3134134 RepID=UPI0031FE8E0F
MMEEAESRLPCLLDRLIDEAPGQAVGPSHRRSISLKEYRMAVLRDLRWLLNSPRHLKTEALYDYPEVARSVLNFGTRDLAGLTSSAFDPLEIESELRDAILHFEPRIIPDSLQVRLIHDAADDGKIAFEINGQLWALPYAERILFRTEMDLETGACELSIIT